MNLDLTGKTAVVCGSTQGIGYATANELASLGANITLIARNEDSLKMVLKGLPVSPGQEHQYLVSDFDRPEELRTALTGYTKNNQVQILVNNTGGPPAGKAIDASTEEFVKAFANHLLCNQILVQAFVPSMREEGYGRVVNIISTSVKAPIPGLGVSNTIRGAVANWAKTLSMELGAFGITVNNVLPGATKTARLDSIITGKAHKEGVALEGMAKAMMEEIPAKRFAEASEVAAAIAFLASPAAAYINGVNLPVDGGRTGSL